MPIIDSIARLTCAALLWCAYAETAAGQEAEPPAVPDVTQEQAPPVAATDPSALPVPDSLPAGTLIEIRIDDNVNSKTHKTGDWYAISLWQPIMIGDQVIIPAGTGGRGQVVHSAKSGWGGKAGELILAARYLEFGDRHIALRGMKLGGVGGNNEGLAFATSVAGGLAAMPVVFMINGKNADIPAGLLATAKLAEPLLAETGVQATTDDAKPTINDDSSTMETGEPK